MVQTKYERDLNSLDPTRPCIWCLVAQIRAIYFSKRCYTGFSFSGGTLVRIQTRVQSPTAHTSFSSLEGAKSAVSNIPIWESKVWNSGLDSSLASWASKYFKTNRLSPRRKSFVCKAHPHQIQIKKLLQIPAFVTEITQVSISSVQFQDSAVQRTENYRTICVLYDRCGDKRLQAGFLLSYSSTLSPRELHVLLPKQLITLLRPPAVDT